MSNHTPGPWDLSADGWAIIGPDQKVVSGVNARGSASHGEVGHISLQEGKANARLIAAAPELLEVVKTMAAYYNDEINLNGTAIKFMLDKAISKAEAKP